MVAVDAKLDRLLADDLVYAHSAGATKDKQEFLEAGHGRYWEYKR